MDTTKLRVTKLRDYLVDIIKDINNNCEQLNVNMLSNNINNYSLDKIPASSDVERWVNGVEIHRDVYSFRSMNDYSQDTINNLENIGFYEIFEKKIKDNNEKNILPDIEGIESINCLTCGTLLFAGTNKAEFEIQIQIKYIIE